MSVSTSSQALKRAVVALVAGALIIAGVVSAPAAANATSGSPSQIARIFADTNAVRAAAGKPPLVETAAMDAVAGAWSSAQASASAMSHNAAVASQVPSGWTAIGENVAAGFDPNGTATTASGLTVSSVVAAWVASPGHYANLIGDYNVIGIGIAFDASGRAYFTQDFGRYPVGSAGYSAVSTSANVVVPASTTSGSGASSGTVSDAQTTPTAAATPVVSGNHLLDSRTGTVWTAHAVNWPSFEYACEQGWGESSGGATAAAAQAMVSWGINAVRLPLNEECWLGTDGQPAYGTAAQYQQAVHAWVSTLNAAGLVVILDLHWSASAGYQADGQRAMADSRSVTFWSQVSAAYSASKSVMFDAFNEPYSRGSFQLSWSCWVNGGCQAPVENDASSGLSGQTYTVAGMSQLVSAIRGSGATQPVLLGGLDYSNDLRGWLANRPADSQLVASWHNYPGQRCDTVTCWNAEIAPVAAQVPVITTEFGETDGGSSFLSTFMTWADAHGIGYSPWAWWEVDSSESVDGSLYALVTGTNFTPKAPSGTTYHDHLAALIAAAAPAPSPAPTTAPTPTPTPTPSPAPAPAPAPAPVQQAPAAPTSSTTTVTRCTYSQHRRVCRRVVVRSTRHVTTRRAATHRTVVHRASRRRR